ncbi:MAG: PA14 domain-containing protein [Roseibacillus sp.]
MLFLNPWLLLGLAGVLVPIILHMMRRQAAKPLDWGAMRFLFDTVAMRRRRMEWEDMLLMAARCLLIGLLALAIARPFVPPDSTIPWIFVLPLALLGIAALGASFVLSAKAARWLTRGAALLLLLAGVALILLERQLNLNRFQNTGSRDIALVIDASTSMEMPRAGGRTAFELAIEEAIFLVKEAPRGSAFSVILGGPAPEQVTGAPLTHRADVIEVLEELRPVGGPFRAHDALGVSLLNLAKGYHGAKEIIVFTDGQRLGWRLESPSAWKSLGDAVEGLPRPPKLLLRIFPPPDAMRNVAVSKVELSREVVGTDREATIRVTIENTGTEAVTPEPLQVTVGEEVLEPVGVGQLAPGQEETVEIRHLFKQAGPVVVEARLDANDDLPVDDKQELVVAVRKRLPILLVDGNPSGGFFERAAGFTALALAPSAELVEGNKPEENYLMEPTVVAAPDITSLENLEEYRVIVLADVVRLPGRMAERMASYVANGGGLLVLAGPRVDEEFYNAWSGPDGELIPVELGALEADEEGLHPAPSTFDHETLVLFKDNKASDLGKARVSGYRKVTAKRKGGSIAARLSNGEPFLAGRNYGKGRVLLSASAFDVRTGNLPTRRSFVPLVHELVTWLAGAGGVSLNVEANWRPALALPGGGGLMGTYYRSDDTRRGIALERIDPTILFDWGGEAPHRGMNKDKFKIHWAGHLVPPMTGDYRFRLEVDDKAQLKIAGKTVLRAQSQGESGNVELKAGIPVPITLDYEEVYSDARIRFFWKVPGGAMEPVPARVLIPVSDGKDSTVVAKSKAVDPRGDSRTVKLSVGRRGRVLELDGAAIPGLYQITVPDQLREEIEEFAAGEVPMVVKRDVRESRLTSLEEDDKELIRKNIDLVEARSVNDLLAVLSGKGFGQELWKFLAVAAFFLLLLEVALARWISMSRRTAEEVKVEFEERGGPDAAILEKMDRLKKVG